jgi:hypothetical protein
MKGYKVSKEFAGQKKELYYSCINKNYDFLKHENPWILRWKTSCQIIIAHHWRRRKVLRSKKKTKKETSSKNITKSSTVHLKGSKDKKSDGQGSGPNDNSIKKHGTALPGKSKMANLIAGGLKKNIGALIQKNSQRSFKLGDGARVS